MHDHTLAKFDRCIELCWSARDTAQSTLFGHCIEEGGAHVAPDHLRIMVDCMQICQSAADFMTRNSAHHAPVCAACAEICAACAASCEAIGGEHMMKCAAACLACAESCRAMAAGTEAGAVAS